ncbi:hypothetical protein PoB_005873500 [Plakobranchus ocellatus]|uniref:Uncharacterized protein n=1 Tax=Plakobranchus ocellatus TaxID=259542 RepID=A0AAV4CH94_9GAST|nr:hypothetical protein PoB_005873500 [Plakobranchus ocellatus]
MTSAVLSAALVLLAAVAVSSSPCTDVCSGTCGTAKQACDLTGFLGDICGVNLNVCNQVCGAVCNCVDTCGASCGGKLTECRGDGSNPLSILPCNLQFANCNVLCNAQCSVTTAAGVFSQITGQGAP